MEGKMKTWYTEKNGEVDRIRKTNGDKSPGVEWKEAPNDWGGQSGDKVKWFDKTMHRIPDQKLIEEGKRKDNTGRWFNKENPSETILIYDLDEEPREEFTKEIPMQNEPYQKWDEKKKKWVVDTEKKEQAEKESKIAAKQTAIEDAERRIQRSVRAKLDGTATVDDESYFNKINAEIKKLRKEKQLLLSA